MTTLSGGIKLDSSPSEEQLKSLGVHSWPTWGCEASKFSWSYDSSETAYMLKGRVIVTPDGGEPVEVKAGDLVTFPAGMSCTWDVREAVHKHYNFEDEELVHKLSAEFYTLQLANAKFEAAKCASDAVRYEQPDAWQQCCAAAGWLRQRVAASYRAQHDFYLQIIQQGTEELAAAEARRPAVIAAEPTLHIDLSEALQQQQPRVDMCRACARWLEQMELTEGSCSAYAGAIQQHFQERGMQVAPGAAAGSPEAAAAATAAPGMPVGEQGQQQAQQQQQGSGGSDAGGAEGAPDTPKQPSQPQQKQQQHTSSDQEQQQQR
ncbi:enzyme of the cupin superfamily isoform B [Micractinium conductrix]|nr:enzyme of the cupin superfamily isoform B [Micractinium conductrix]|eukprot:PSC75663.1 enzyme of the cupin superfamily isoform B [Micractinium conductrix]